MIPLPRRAAALVVLAATPLGLRRRAYRAVYLRSTGWHELARAVRRSQRGRCAACGRRARLDVHHRHYATLGRETRGDVVGLCEPCHLRRHGAI